MSEISQGKTETRANVRGWLLLNRNGEQEEISLSLIRRREEREKEHSDSCNRAPKSVESEKRQQCHTRQERARKKSNGKKKENKV